MSGIVDLIDGGPDVAALLLTGLVTWIVGSVVWRTTVVPSQIRVLDVFTTVTIAWVTIAAVGAIPYLVTGHFTRIDDALFEAMSGFTTTGATVTADIEATSKGLLFWRSMTQWMGGMGVIVLVVAVLPTVGSGGMSLLEAEAPGPTGERLTPRVRETARRLWAVYLGFTVLMATAYFVAGMSLFDAVSHSFTTVSTGGFSPYQGSFGHFESATLEWICIVGMMLAGGSFTLYWRALRGNVKPLLRSTEFRVYLLMVGAMTLWAFDHGRERRKPVDWFPRCVVHGVVDGHDDRVRRDGVRLVERDCAIFAAHRVATGSNGRLDGRWHQDSPHYGGVELCAPRGAQASPSEAGPSRSCRQRDVVRRRGWQGCWVSHPCAGDFWWRFVRDRSHRPGPHHVVFGIGDVAWQRWAGSRCARPFRGFLGHPARGSLDRDWADAARSTRDLSGDSCDQCGHVAPAEVDVAAPHEALLSRTRPSGRAGVS